MAVANQPGEKYNPLFIYGGVGLGKTHLVTAIGHHIWASGERPKGPVHAGRDFHERADQFAAARQDGRVSSEKFRRVDTLILDDVQFLAGRERTQEEFFHTFNALHSERHQIMLTSDKVPREIPGLEERLRNRFEIGADRGHRAARPRDAGRDRAEEGGARKPAAAPDVAMYIAQNVSSNVRELEGCLTRLAALASMDRSPITVEFARQALQDLIRMQDAKPDIDRIQKTVSDFFHIRLADLKSKKRTQHIAFCRQVAMYLCRKLTDSSFPTIGEHFGRDHSTVIHAYNLIMRRVSNDSAFRHLDRKNRARA